MPTKNNYHILIEKLICDECSGLANLSFALNTTRNCLQHIIQVNELGKHQSLRDSLNLAANTPKESEFNSPLN